jgi:hypothetical protein
MSTPEPREDPEFFGSPTARRGLAHPPQPERRDEQKRDSERFNASIAEGIEIVQEGRGNDRGADRTRAIVETWRRETRELKAEEAWETSLTVPQVVSEGKVDD